MGKKNKKSIAEHILEIGASKLYSSDLERKFPYAQYMTMMLWDAVAHGMVTFADGEVLSIDKYSDWLATVKYVTDNIDGPLASTTNINLTIKKQEWRTTIIDLLEKEKVTAAEVVEELGEEMTKEIMGDDLAERLLESAGVTISPNGKN